MYYYVLFETHLFATFIDSSDKKIRCLFFEMYPKFDQNE